MPLRIPDLVATTPPVGISPFGRAVPAPIALPARQLPAAPPPSQFVAGPQQVFGVPGGEARAIHQGAEAVQHTVRSASEQLARVEQEKRRQSQATEAMGLFLTASEQIAQRELELQTGQRDPMTGQSREAPVTHEDYVPRLRQSLDAIRQGVLDTTQDPEVQQAAGRLIDRLVTERTIEGMRVANRLFVTRERAATTDFLATLARKAALDPDPAMQRFFDALADGYLASKRGGVYNDEEIGRLRRNFTEQVAVTNARRAIEAGTFTPERYIDRVNPAQLDSLLRQNESAERQRALTQERQERVTSQQLERERQALLTDLESQAANGTLTLTQLDTRRELRQLTPEDYRRLRTAIERPKEQPSDAAVLDRILSDVHGLTPRTSEVTINQLHQTYLDGGPGLNLADTVRAKDQLRTARATITSEAGRRQAQAEQILATGLTTRSPFEALDPVSQKAKALALQELSRRSQAFGGQEDPLAVAEEILPRYQRLLDGEHRLTVSQLQSLLRYPTVQALEAARRAGQISDGDYQTQKKLFIDLHRASQATAPGPPPSGAVLGRSPTTPARINRGQ